MAEKWKNSIFFHENHYLAPKCFVVRDFIDLQHILYHFHHGAQYSRCIGGQKWLKMAQNDENMGF